MHGADGALHQPQQGQCGNGPADGQAKRTHAEHRVVGLAVAEDGGHKVAAYIGAKHADAEVFEDEDFFAGACEQTSGAAEEDTHHTPDIRVDAVLLKTMNRPMVAALGPQRGTYFSQGLSPGSLSLCRR